MDESWEVLERDKRELSLETGIAGREEGESSARSLRKGEKNHPPAKRCMNVM